MSVILWIAVYGALHLACVALLVRLRPEWVLARKWDWRELRSRATPEEHAAWGKTLSGSAAERAIDDAVASRLGYDNSWQVNFDRNFPGVFVVAVAPACAALLLPVSLVLRASMNSLNNQRKARTELEKELAAAKKEIDELLGRKS